MTTRLRNAVTLVAIGTLCWVIAGIIAVAVNAEAEIIYTCIMGAALGLMGIRYTVRRDKRSGL